MEGSVAGEGRWFLGEGMLNFSEEEEGNSGLSHALSGYLSVGKSGGGNAEGLVLSEAGMGLQVDSKSTEQGDWC